MNHANAINATACTTNNFISATLCEPLEALTCDANKPHFIPEDRNLSSPTQRQLTLHLNVNSRPRSNAEEKYLLADSREVRKNGAGRRSCQERESAMRRGEMEEDVPGSQG